MTADSSTNSTWGNTLEMQRGMTLMLQGTPYFAWQHVRGREAPYFPCRDLQQLDDCVEDIFYGLKTPGFYAIRPDNRTRWGAVDFDSHGTVGKDRWQTEARKVFEFVKKKFDECWFLETHPGGFHVIGFASEAIPAKEFRTILKEVVPDGVEIFPKQDQLENRSNAKGSLLRFPGKHQLKGHWGRFLDRSGRIQNVIQDTPPRTEKWQEPSLDSQLKSLFFRATKGLEISTSGQRHQMMQRLAGRLKGRANEKDSVAIYTAWHNRYASLIRTPFEDSLAKFLIWYRKADPCSLEIPNYSLTAAEEIRIKNLFNKGNRCSELLQEVARMFFQVSKHASKKGIQPFLSCRTIAEKLDVSIPSACRYRAACEKAGLVKLVERGYTGVASTYELIE